MIDNMIVFGFQIFRSVRFLAVLAMAVLWFVPGWSSSAAGPEQNIHFTRISIESGLSQSTIFSIAQDRTGNMWFATYDGVNKYDGYREIFDMDDAINFLYKIPGEAPKGKEDIL